MSLLNDLGLGRYSHSDFFAVTLDATAEGTVVDGYNIEADTAGEVIGGDPVDKTGGRMRMITDGDQDDGIIAHQQVGEGMVIGSGKKVWFEASVALEDAAQDVSYFFGLVEEDGLDVDVLLDANISVGTESMYGFLFHGGDDTGALDAVFNLDGAAGTVVLADVTRAASYTGPSGNDAADFAVALVFHKFGLRFDGQKTLEYYFDGYKVAELTLVSGTHPVGVDLGPIIAAKCGAGGADAIIVDWIRWAYQERT
jgi:hypothetical protein